MGCDCRVMLPQNVRIEDVAEVCGILLGMRKEKMHLSDGAWSVKVPGISYDMMPSIPGMVSIRLQGCTVGEEIRSFTFHFQTEGDYFLLNLRSTALNIAMARKVMRFFGGTVDANDCDEVEVDFEWTRQPRIRNSPSDGKEWDEFQMRMWNIKPLTESEIQRSEKFAAYKQGE